VARCGLASNEQQRERRKHWRQKEPCAETPIVRKTIEETAELVTTLRGDGKPGEFSPGLMKLVPFR
jgi:hypothetical protein